MQTFYINKGSVLPTLRMELADDGLIGFAKRDMFNNMLQNCDVTFSMRDSEGRLRISRGKAYVVRSKEEECEERYLIEYRWNERDTKVSGEFKGSFDIKFGDPIYEEGVTYPEGNLIVPIHEELIIMVRENAI